MPLTASVIWLPSSSVIGGSPGAVVVVAVHPGTGLTLTKASGVSVGSCTFSPTVAAVSLSDGTRKVSSPKPPGAASVDPTVTWAEAAPVPRARTATTVASRPSRARNRRTGTPRCPVADPLTGHVADQEWSLVTGDQRGVRPRACPSPAGWPHAPQSGG